MERIPFEQGMLLNKGQRLSIHLIVAGLVLRTYRGNLVVADPLYLECDEFCRMASLYRYVVGFLLPPMFKIDRVMPRCENPCGKLPRRLPEAGSTSSASRPRSLA